MAEWKEIERIHGKHATYSVQQRPGGIFSSPKYYVIDADTQKSIAGSFSSRSDAVDWVKDRVARGK